MFYPDLVMYSGCISILNLAKNDYGMVLAFQTEAIVFLENLPDCWVVLNSLVGPQLFGFLLKMLHLLLPEALNQLFYCLFIDDSSSIRSSMGVCRHPRHPRSWNPRDFVSS